MPFFKRNDVFANRYLLEELLSNGDAHEVWKAKDKLADNAFVVLKFPISEKGITEDRLRQLRQEFYLSNHFAHPHLLRANQFDILEGIAFLLGPFFPLGSLKDQAMQEDFSLSEKEVALVLSQIGQALQYLHQQNPPIHHQAVKPGNILLSDKENYMLAGLGSSAGEGLAGKEPKAVPHTGVAAYAPPEDFDPDEEKSTAGDIFSLGVTLYELCARTIPWGARGGKALLQGEQVPDLPEQYSRELNELIKACMSVDKNKRPEALELQSRGQHYLRTASWSLTETAGEGSKWNKKGMFYGLAAAVVALLIIGAFWISNNDHTGLSKGKLQNMVGASGQDDQEIDAMLLEVLEEENRELVRENMELKDENRQLMRQTSANVNFLESEEPVVSKDQNTEQEEAATEVAEKAAPKKVAVASAVAPKEKNNSFSPKELEKQLNKIADPDLSASARAAWKAETMDRFAENVVQITDETGGASRQYSASIFLNLLYNVPHTIKVTEVKRDQNQKVTELRLTMETKQ